MKKKAPLTLEEVKKLQFDMLIDFDKFCRENNITYFLSYGTLLGAVRHKGYIPWDDDIDVMVPRPEIEKLIRLYNTNESKDYKIVDHRNKVDYEMAYPRMIATKTFHKFYSSGVNIDIYPIDAFPDSDAAKSKYRRDIRRIRNIRVFLIKLKNKFYSYWNSWNKTFPLINHFARIEDNLLSSAKYEDAIYVHVYDPDNHWLNKDIFSGKVEVNFEGRMFYAPSGWQEFLSMAYGNFMELPPEDKRNPYHCTDLYYWK